MKDEVNNALSIVRQACMRVSADFQTHHQIQKSLSIICDELSKSDEKNEKDENSDA